MGHLSVGHPPTDGARTNNTPGRPYISHQHSGVPTRWRTHREWRQQRWSPSLEPQQRRKSYFAGFRRTCRQGEEISPDGRCLVSAGDDGLRLWSVADGRLLQLLQGPTRGARSCAFSPDGRWLASSSLDHTLCQWEIDGSAGGVLRRTLHHHSNIVPALLYSPDGDYLISSSFDRTLCRWDAHTGTLQASWPTHDTFHLALAIHPDGRLLAVGGTDQIIRLLDIESGRVCRSYMATPVLSKRSAIQRMGNCWPASAMMKPSVCGRKQWTLPANPARARPL